MQGLQALGLPASAADPLLAYQDELLRWNQAYNLTAIREPRGMVVRHLLDSLAILPLMRGRVLDVGSGAGLPAVPLAIVAPGLAISALDSNGKKARFLRHVQRSLKLDNLEVLETRVEKLAADPLYDTITSRAFASLAEFVELTRKLLAPSGQWVAMKGKLEPAELAGIPADVEIKETRRLRVPGLNEERHAVVAVLK